MPRKISAQSFFFKKKNKKTAKYLRINGYDLETVKWCSKQSTDKIIW